MPRPSATVVVQGCDGAEQAVTALRGGEGSHWQSGGHGARGPGSNQGPTAAQVGRHRLQPQRWEDLQQRRWQRLPGQPQELGAALAAGQALLADLGGPKVALAEAAPLPLPAPQPLTGVWDKVRLPVPDGMAGFTQSPDLQAQRQTRFLTVIRFVAVTQHFATRMSTTGSGSSRYPRMAIQFHAIWGTKCSLQVCCYQHVRNDVADDRRIAEQSESSTAKPSLLLPPPRFCGVNA